MESVANRAVTYVPSGEGKPLYFVGDLYTFKVTGEQTNGALGLWEALIPPQAGPPPHIHHREDECFYVLEGEFEFPNDGDDVVRAGAGSLVYVPRGNLHTYKNVGPEPGRMLVSQTPGGSHERFFEELGEQAQDSTTPPASEGPPDVRRIVVTAAKYGIEMPPPAS